MLGLMFFCVFVTVLIGTGFWLKKHDLSPRNPKAVLGFVMAIALLVLVLSVSTALAAESGADGSKVDYGTGLALIGVALSTGLACVGAGVGVAFVGAAALGVVSEKPALFGTTLIYIGLAEGIAIYGIVISLFIMNRI